MKTRSGAVSPSKIYYSPGGYWKGYSAFSKLADAAGVSENEAKEWAQEASFVADLFTVSEIYSETALDC